MIDMTQCTVCGAPIWVGFDMCPACKDEPVEEVIIVSTGVEDAPRGGVGRALHERDEEIIKLKMALTAIAQDGETDMAKEDTAPRDELMVNLMVALLKIERGNFEGASTLALAGDWQGMYLSVQKIARDALKE